MDFVDEEPLIHTKRFEHLIFRLVGINSDLGVIGIGFHLPRTEGELAQTIEHQHRTECSTEIEHKAGIDEETEGNIARAIR